MSVTNISDHELVARAIKNARPKTCGESPRWVAVSDTFALGSTYSSELCRVYGVDPYEMVNGPRCISCNP